MNAIRINPNVFLALPSFYVDHIKIHGHLLYKRNPLAKPVIDRLDRNKNNPLIKNYITVAEEYLIDDINDNFFGFSMQNYLDLLNIRDVANSDEFNFEKFLLSLFMVLENLEKAEMCFYDLKVENVYIRDKKPFLVDPDGMLLHPTFYDKKKQRQKLLDFIFKIKFNDFYGYNILKELLRKINIEDYFSKDFVYYLEEIFDFSSSMLMYPNSFVKELNDDEKLIEMKKKLI